MRTPYQRQGGYVRHNSNRVTVIGAGLAGSEAAWQIAESGIDVDLFEMRPQRMTPAHSSEKFSELVCSNSFGSDSLFSASRILKEELELLGSLTLEVARKNSVPAGASLAVDREKFSAEITSRLTEHPRIHICKEELTSIPEEGEVIVATGPLTSAPLAESLQKKLGESSLYFYDAISPIVSAESLDRSIIFAANRYGKGETADFLNIPLTKEEYFRFIEELLKGEVILPHDFEEAKYFEGCMPIEAIAERGPMTLAFGPMKPVGLEDPRTGRRPFAVVQLRAENAHLTAYNLVGFQTKLKYPEQQRIFKMLPGMANVEFFRLGSMHRNTYIHSPKHLLPTLQLRVDHRVSIAGQLTGTEGYLESSACGLWAGKNVAHRVLGKPLPPMPLESMLGALFLSITDSEKKHFQPTNVNMGILPPLSEPVRDKKLRNEKLGLRALESLKKWLSGVEGENYLNRPMARLCGSLPNACSTGSP